MARNIKCVYIGSVDRGWFARSIDPKWHASKWFNGSIGSRSLAETKRRNSCCDHVTCSTDATRTVFHLSSESIHIFQLIDFGITLQLRYSVDETAHTKSLFISSSLLLVFVLFAGCLYASKMRNEVKQERERDEAAREWDGSGAATSMRRKANKFSEHIRYACHTQSIVDTVSRSEVLARIYHCSTWRHRRTAPNLLSKEICCLQKSETETLKTHARRIYFSPRLAGRRQVGAAKLKADGKSHMMMLPSFSAGGRVFRSTCLDFVDWHRNSFIKFLSFLYFIKVQTSWTSKPSKLCHPVTSSWGKRKVSSDKLHFIPMFLHRLISFNYR